MTLSIYTITVPVMLNGLGAMAHLLDKAAAHVRDTGCDPAVVLDAGLAPDMLPLAAQVRLATDIATQVVEKLIGDAAPNFPEADATLRRLDERVARTVAFLRAATSESFAGCEGREVTVRAFEHELRFTGETYVLRFALPNFFFHLTTTYDILRHLGVELGKRDYLVPFVRGQ